jgi:hypothetical protein
MMFGPLHELINDMERMKRSVLFARKASAHIPASV